MKGFTYMSIDKKIATQLIKVIQPLIPYNINIIDTTGIIIASTDSNRINSKHEGSLHLINSDKQELIVQSDTEIDGCKEGINLPITVNHKLIGILGITGKINDILNYGKIIQMLTELMIQNIHDSVESEKREKEKQYFFVRWLNSNLISDCDIKNNLRKFGYIPFDNYRVILVQIHKSKDNLYDKLLKEFNTLIITNKDILLVEKAELVWITHIKDLDIIYETLNAANVSFKNNAECEILGGIGNDKNISNISESYYEAKQSLKYANSSNSIIHYSKYLFQITLSSIPVPIQQNFVNNIFSNYSREELLSICNFIKLYFENNGHINIIASKLYIHKNTVQYRINKIKAKTNLDLRNTSDSFQLYSASLFFENCIKNHKL